MSLASYRVESREDYHCEKGRGFDQSELKTGALLRIADACEMMAKDKERLESQSNFYKQTCSRAIETEAWLIRRLSAAKGQITKLKKRIAELEEEK